MTLGTGGGAANAQTPPAVSHVPVHQVLFQAAEVGLLLDPSGCFVAPSLTDADLDAYNNDNANHATAAQSDTGNVSSASSASSASAAAAAVYSRFTSSSSSAAAAATAAAAAAAARGVAVGRVVRSHQNVVSHLHSSSVSSLSSSMADCIRTEHVCTSVTRLVKRAKYKSSE